MLLVSFGGIQLFSAIINEQSHRHSAPHFTINDQYETLQSTEWFPSVCELLLITVTSLYVRILRLPDQIPNLCLTTRLAADWWIRSSWSIRLVGVLLTLFSRDIRDHPILSSSHKWFAFPNCLQQLRMRVNTWCIMLKACCTVLTVPFRQNYRKQGPSLCCHSIMFVPESFGFQ